MSELDLSRSGLDGESAAQVLQAEDGLIVVKGRLGRREPRFGTRPLLVSEAFHGLPGATGAGAFYQVSVNDPPIMCITAPCNNDEAQLLNHRTSTSFTRVSAEHVAVPFIDQAWLVSRIEEHEAVVQGELVAGAPFPGGPEKVLDATQVFVKLPEAIGPCPGFAAIRCPEGEVNVTRRTPDRCIVPDGCVEPGFCTLSIPVCEPGYELVSWRVAPAACPAYACDPVFSMAVPESRCASIRCAAGYHCTEEGEDPCVPDLTCASVLCMAGSTCVERPSGPTCLPVRH